MPSGDVKKAQARAAFDRVLDRVVVDDETGCWVWPGASFGRPGKKYGIVTVGSRSDGTRRLRSTHIVVWEGFEGPVPDGLELDHLCRVTRCCNPGHLEPVTHAENMRRMLLSEAERKRRREWMRQVSQRRWAA